MRDKLQRQKREIPRSGGDHPAKDPEIRPIYKAVLELFFLGGVLLPLLISFTDITLRTILQEYLSQIPLMVLSFLLLFTLYGFGYYFLWQWIVKKYDGDRTKLLELGTLSVLLSDIAIYASLFQLGNTLSNLIWLGFYLILIAIFYLLGKQRINQSQT
ncbi:hypothetical protein [Sulfurimonas sp. HSL3-7]|uniref:hypothetical protein n=1 Tax=Sulfonitrofixus jiaomeiensis TaxID=3131938 RepID=UPI0031F850C8